MLICHNFCIFMGMKFDLVKGKRVLISPLNWGMGHVSRCIGLIHRLEKNNNTVIIACNQKQKLILEQYFPTNKFISHQGYPFRFSGRRTFGLDLIRSSNKLKTRYQNELLETEKLGQEHNIDVVISDHRYGFRSEKVPSIFVTHQVRLPVRWFEISAQMLHKSLLKKYDCVWVLDFADHRLAGNLSKNNASLSVDYLGAVSRFETYEKYKGEKRDTVVIVSGPSVYGQQFIDNLVLDDDPSNLYSVVAKNDVNIPLRFKHLKGSWVELDQEIMKIDLQNHFHPYISIYRHVLMVNQTFLQHQIDEHLLSVRRVV